MSRILALDASGQPKEWVSHQDAIIYHAKNLVAWQLGEGQGDVMFRGGENRITGTMSAITTAPIIAIKGKTHGSTKRAFKTPTLNNPDLFARDRHICAYCGGLFRDSMLSRDHVKPTSRGGEDKWTNVVTACLSCNHKKDDWLLEEIGMELLYVPYTPNWAEALMLENRNVLACQMDYLSGFLTEDVKKFRRQRDSLASSFN